MADLVPVDAAPLPAAPARPADRNPARVYLDNLKSAETRRTMTGCLRTLARLITGDPHADPDTVPWEHLRFQHTANLRVLLAQQTTDDGTPWSPATLNKHLSALRGVLKAAWRLGLMTTDDHGRATDFPNDTGTRLPAGRSIARTEMAAMLRAALDGTLTGYRNAAIVATLAATGARRAEIAAARRDHYDPGRRALRIIGKGDHQREVYVNEDAAVYLGAWLARHDARTGPLFCPIDRWGNAADRHMSSRAIGAVIDDVRRAAELPRLTPHDFRRTFVGELLDSGADLATVQALAGHAHPTTTARYDRRPAAARQAAANRLHLPRPEDLGIDL